MYNRDQIVKIYENSQKYGGSFSVALCEALLKADYQNQAKLEKEFKDLFDSYLKF